MTVCLFPAAVAVQEPQELEVTGFTTRSDMIPQEQVLGHTFSRGSQEPPASRGCQQLYIS